MDWPGSAISIQCPPSGGRQGLRCSTANPAFGAKHLVWTNPPGLSAKLDQLVGLVPASDRANPMCMSYLPKVNPPPQEPPGLVAWRKGEGIVGL